jgi:hypothetical protein
MLIFAGGNGGNDFGRVRDSMEGFVFDILVVSLGLSAYFRVFTWVMVFWKKASLTLTLWNPLGPRISLKS